MHSLWKEGGKPKLITGVTSASEKRSLAFDMAYSAAAFYFTTAYQFSLMQGVFGSVTQMVWLTGGSVQSSMITQECRSCGHAACNLLQRKLWLGLEEPQIEPGNVCAKDHKWDCLDGIAKK